MCFGRWSWLTLPTSCPSSARVLYSGSATSSLRTDIRSPTTLFTTDGFRRSPIQRSTVLSSLTPTSGPLGLQPHGVRSSCTSAQRYTPGAQGLPLRRMTTFWPTSEPWVTTVLGYEYSLEMNALDGSTNVEDGPPPGNRFGPSSPHTPLFFSTQSSFPRPSVPDRPSPHDRQTRSA